MSYTQRYRTPSPHYPLPSPTTLDRLIHSWEVLRDLNRAGYRTSQATPMSTWLIDIDWGDARSVRSPGGGTTCSPFVTQAVAMAYSQDSSGPYAPRLASGEALSFLFSRAANGTLGPAQARAMERCGMTLADNEWPRPIIFYNMGHAVEPTEMRRGDAVHIDWMTGGGHAVFCWDVHLNARGEVDAFQYVSSNGRIRVGGKNEGAGLGVSVGGTPAGNSGFIRQRSAEPPLYDVLRDPLFVDDDRYVAEGAWVTWNPQLKMRDLTGCRVPVRGRLSYAKTIKVARFHGVQPPPPYAMGAPGQTGAGGPVAGTPPRAPGADDTVTLQRQLTLLCATGWLQADPGDVDGHLGPRVRAAVQAFQVEYGLQADGVAGPKTRAKLSEVYRAACLSPAGKEYLATGAVGLTAPAGMAPSYALSAPAAPPRLYFRHGVARPGDQVAVILEAEGIEGRPIPLYLRDVDRGTSREADAFILSAAGRGQAWVRIPPSVARPHTGRWAVGSTVLGYESPVPLRVIDGLGDGLGDGAGPRRGPARSMGDDGVRGGTADGAEAPSAEGDRSRGLV